VRTAEQNRAAATLRSPIAGRVAAVGLSAGATSSGRTITIVGTGVPKVSTTVPLAQVELVKVGQPVVVAADGVRAALTGHVSSIGMLSSTSGSTTTFPVTVQLDAGGPQLYDGAGADVRITTGTARNVVAVPNSAVHSSFGGTHTVTVITGGTTSTARVSLGVAGSDLTQVMSGLKAGDQVVLADYSQPIPASTNTNTGFARFFTRQ
jgi:multidrug efflux pump subunit AcrA (membrane-fusion protein)